ncbi:hypothetical protein JX266_013363 [Neoarthrinium moseri]|uniref:uncharacterized protein n=1 Tax=Neoarthrinium moseri TaxID=1658444 RepID=UPI001FDC8C8E|nr:uncharacterized protein JN550_013764 [Neoarthrinium moseri]KAI1840436.1 hypothetical protein JX266_013363 [Neoarthrinium moseri]KAI1856523.1 hypothetical protein JN550_013764 [Neoarthrinium moseri]
MQSNVSWATAAAEWESHKGLIAYFYLTCGKTLREVKEIMHQQYSFQATERMYKARLKTWGFRKYLKSCEAEGFAHTPVEGPQDHVPVMCQRQLVSKREMALNTQKELSSTHCMGVETGLNPNPPVYLGLKRIEPPDHLRSSEAALWAVVNYSKASFETMRWNLTDHDLGADRTRIWWIEIQLAAQAVKDGRETEAGFAALSKCCGQYRSILQRDDAILIHCSYTAILQLAAIGKDLAMLLLNFISELCHIELGPSHPVAAFWASIRNIGVSGARDAAEPIMKAQLSLIEDHASPGSLAAAIFSGTLDPESVQDVTTATVARLCSRSTENSSHWMHWHIWARLSSSPSLYVDHGTFIATQYDTLLRRLDQDTLRRTRPSKIHLEMDIMQVTGSIQEFMGRTSHAEQFYRRAVDLALHQNSMEHPRILEAYNSLQSYYTRQGDAYAAQALRYEWKMHY